MDRPIPATRELAKHEAERFKQRLEELAAEYNIAAMKCDEGYFEVSVYALNDLETFVIN